MASTKVKSGIVIEQVVPGAFYQGIFPGGFRDALTGIHIPGPIVNLDRETKRQVVSVHSMPDPVQLPHSKEVYDYKDKDRKVRELTVVPFDRQDESPMHDAFNLALATGIIRRVEDADVQALYPAAWEQRKEKFVFTREVAAVPMVDLIAEYNNEKAHGAKKAHAEGQERAIKAATPPPPKN